MPDTKLTLKHLQKLKFAKTLAHKLYTYRTFHSSVMIDG